jgi:hypothetical protein
MGDPFDSDSPLTDLEENSDEGVTQPNQSPDIDKGNKHLT